MVCDVTQGLRIGWEITRGVSPQEKKEAAMNQEKFPPGWDEDWHVPYGALSRVVATVSASGSSVFPVLYAAEKSGRP